MKDNQFTTGHLFTIIKSIPEPEGLALFNKIAKEVDVNEKEGNIAPLHLAIYAKKDQYVKALLDHNADINLLGPDNLNALQVAVAFGSYESVKILIEAQANVHVLWNKDGKELSLLDILSDYHAKNAKPGDDTVFTNKVRLLCNLNVKYKHLNFIMVNGRDFEDIVASTKGTILFSKFVPLPSLPGVEQACVFVADEAKNVEKKEEDYQPGVPKFKPGFMNKR